jgi:hypothetical protein
MKVITICQCERWVPALGANEHLTRFITRPYPLSLPGAYDIIRRQRESIYPVKVVSVSHRTVDQHAPLTTSQSNP